MAEYLTTDTDLKAVADAIRAKGGTSEQLTYPGGFVSAVQAISAGGITPSGSISITANGTYDVTSKASAVVNVPTSGGSSSTYITDLGAVNFTETTGAYGNNDYTKLVAEFDMPQDFLTAYSDYANAGYSASGAEAAKAYFDNYALFFVDSQTFMDSTVLARFEIVFSDGGFGGQIYWGANTGIYFNPGSTGGDLDPSTPADNVMIFSTSADSSAVPEGKARIEASFLHAYFEDEDHVPTDTLANARALLLQKLVV